MNRNCSACNIKTDLKNYKGDRTVCKTCYNKNKRKNNNNLLPSETITASHQQPKIEKINNNNNKNRTLVIGFSKCGKTYLMNFILLEKQEPIFIITESLYQNPNIKAQTSDEIQPKELYKNSIVVFDDMLLSKQESNFDLIFTRSRHQNIDIHYISQKYFHLPKDTIRKKSFKIILFKQTLRDIILLLHDITGLDMKLEEWKQLCRTAW